VKKSNNSHPDPCTNLIHTTAVVLKQELFQVSRPRAGAPSHSCPINELMHGGLTSLCMNSFHSMGQVSKVLCDIAQG